MLEVFIALGFVPRPCLRPSMAALSRHTLNRPPHTEMDAPMTPHRPFHRRLKRLAAIPLTILALALPPSAMAANSLDPICQLQDGSVLFFTESTRACPQRHGLMPRDVLVLRDTLPQGRRPLDL